MTVEKDLGLKLKFGVMQNEPMSKHTSWIVGGPADYFLRPVDSIELAEILRYGWKNNLPVFILGNGSNLLVLDGGIRGMVVEMGQPFSYVHRKGCTITAGAGTSMTYLSRSAADMGLAGLEFAAGIPGSLGGALIMNAGAFGGYIGESVGLVKLISYLGEEIIMKMDELYFSYRCSNLAGKGVIVEAELELKRAEPAVVQAKTGRFLEERRSRHPEEPSAGSVFRNLPGKPAGLLIDSAGGKGMRIGGAEVSTKHANFIINTGYATAADILSLMQAVRRLVKDKHGVELHPEVRIVGEER